MRRSGRIAIILLLIALAVVGCGLNNELATAKSDLATAQSNIAALQNEYDTLKRSYDSLKNDYDKIKEELDAAQAKVKQVQQDLMNALLDRDALAKKVREAKARAEVLRTLFVPSLTGEDQTLTQREQIDRFLQWGDLIALTRDRNLVDKYMALGDSIMNGTYSREILADLLIYLLESLVTNLELTE